MANKIVQDVFSIRQQRGMVGMVSRPTQSFAQRIRVIGTPVVQPGQAYILVAGVAELPANAGEAALAVGIMSLSHGEINADITKTKNRE